ncbi:MAG: hypothetical protein ACOZF0_17945 [Thermodesulfobacteriota bacterium]
MRGNPQRTLQLISIGLLGLIILTGCRGGYPQTVEPEGSPPFIVYVQTGKILYGNYLATSSFRIGDTANFKITVIDDDLDIQSLSIRRYFPKDATEPIHRFKPFELHQQKERRESFLLNEPFEVTGPTGECRYDLLIEDAQGNKSNIYKLFVIVH